MPAVARRDSSKAQGKNGSRSADAKKIARKAADLLISGHLLPDEARDGATRTLEVIIKGVEISLRRGKSMRVEVIFTPRSKIQVSRLSFSNVTSLEKSEPAKEKRRMPLPRPSTVERQRSRKS